MKTLCLFVTNDLINDPRVVRTAKLAVQAGLNVHVLCTLSDRTKEFEEKDGYKIHRFKVGWRDIGITIFKKLFSTKNKKKEYIKQEGQQKEGFLQKLKLLFYILYVKKLNKVFAKKALKLNADICHCNDLDTLEAGIEVKRKNNAKIIYDAHEIFAEQHIMEKFWKKYWLNIEKKLIAKTDWVISVNQHIVDYFKKLYPDIKNTEVVFNCPFLESININPKDKNKIIILYQGRYENYRGLEELIKSMKWVNDNALLYIRGYGPAELKIRKLVTELNLDNKIKFLEPTEMKDLVKEASIGDIGVVSYKPMCLDHIYATPNKFFEYMMAGLALAVSDFPAMKEIVSENKLGITFNPEDPENIAKALNKLVENRELLQNSKKNALKAARERFNWEKEGEKLVKIYMRD